jgi:acyl-CoA synthetase (AMP-forming)/AMP-acid ligase II
VGLPDHYWGEVVVAAYELSPGHTVTSDELAAHCRARLAAYKVPVGFQAVTALPRNANGKVQKHKIVAELGRRPAVEMA